MRDGRQQPGGPVPILGGRVDLNRFMAGWINAMGWRRAHFIQFNPVGGMTAICGSRLPLSGADAVSWVIWGPADYPPRCARCQNALEGGA